MSFKRVSLNLVHYFQDYRQFSRICLKNDVVTISDLKKYICDVFDIENRFYLMCDHFYLPASENIEILDDNELIYVMPDFQKQTCDLDTKVKSDKNKIKKEAKFRETEAPIKEKYKENLGEQMVCNDEIWEKKKKNKEKSKKKRERIEENKIYHLKESHLNDNMMPEMQVKNNKIINNTSYINKEFEMEICDNTENTKKTNLEVDETIVDEEIFNKSQLRPRKKRRCISPMETEGANQNSNKEYIASEQENKIIVQSIEVLNEEKQQKIIENITKNPECKRYSLNEVLNFEDRKKSPNKQNENQCSEYDGILNVQSRKQIVKTISGIGAILQNLNESTDTSFQSEDNFITRRNRHRVRPRKKKKNVEETSLIDSPIFKPPKTIANPKLHIKFDENNEETENRQKDSFVCSTPLKTNNNEMNKNSTNTEIQNMTFDDVDVDKFIDLSGMPSVNDLITFKKLKMGQNYNPEISQCILAAVRDIPNSQQLRIKILDGMNEFKEPMGRFSCITEEEENDLEETNEVVLALNSLIEPKLYKI